MADVFISYSRKDKGFVAKLDKALKAYKPPKGLNLEQRNLDIFLDTEDFTGNDYKESVARHLKNSGKLLLVCSPNARRSSYVNDEVKVFAEVKGAKNIVPLLISGLPNNEAKSGQEDEMAFPEALCAVMQMPLAADYRNFDLRKDRVDRGIFYGAWFTTLANICGTSRSEIEQRDKKRRANRRKAIIGIVSGVILALSGALTYALISRAEAVRQRRAAQARQLETQARIAFDSSGDGLQRSALFAVESLKSAWTVDGYIACTRAVSLLPLRPNVRQAHNAGVVAVAYSADGRWLASEDKQANLVVWDTIAKRQIVPEMRQRAHMVFASLAFTPDSQWLVSTSGQHALVRDTKTWKEVKALPNGDMVWSVAFSSSGDLAATASYHSSQMKLYQTSTWDEVAPWDELAEMQKGGGWVWAVAFSPNGQWLARAGDLLTIWDLAAKKLNRTENIKARSLAFSPDSQSLIAAGEFDGLRQIALAEGMNPELFAEHTGQARGVAFSKDGRYLASPTSVWDAKSKKELLRIPQEALAGTFTPAGDAVVTGNVDGSIAEWPISRGIFTKSFGYSSPATAVAFSPKNGDFLVTANGNGELHVLKTEGGNWSQTVSKAFGGSVSTVGFSPDGQWLFAIVDQAGRLFSAPDWKEAPSQLELGSGSVEKICFSPDGKWIAAQTRRRVPDAHGYLWTRRVFELSTRNAVGWNTRADVLNVPSSELTSGGDLILVESSESWPTVRIGGNSEKSSDGRWRTSFGEEFKLVDAQSERPADIVQHDGSITDATFSPNGRWLVTASEDCTVRVWPLWAEDLLPPVRLHLQRNLTYDEWRQAFENEPYSKTCPDLPIHPSFLQAGQELLAKNDFQGAHAIFRRAVALEPNNSEARKLLDVADKKSPNPSSNPAQAGHTPQ
jgi:WD40 repeat protein